MSIYFVDCTHGIDTNDGKTLQTPFKTIYAAYNVARAGDTVNFLAGTYPYPINDCWWRMGDAVINRGTFGLPITYQAYNGANVTWIGGRTFRWNPVLVPAPVTTSTFTTAITTTTSTTPTTTTHTTTTSTSPVAMVSPTSSSISHWFVDLPVGSCWSNASGIVHNGWSCTPLALSAWCDATDPAIYPVMNVSAPGVASRKLSGRFEVYHLDYTKKSYYFAERYNHTNGEGWCLFWNGKDWIIYDPHVTVNGAMVGLPSIALPKPVDYWSSPTLVGSYVPHGACKGNPKIVWGDNFITGGNGIIPAGFKNPLDASMTTCDAHGKAGDNPFLDNHGKLLFDLTYYNPITRRLYFKSNQVELIDPNAAATQVYQVGLAATYSDNCNYYQFKNIKFEYGTGAFNGTGSNTLFDGCTFKHIVGQGFLGGGSSITINKCVFDFVSGYLVYNNSDSPPGNWYNQLDHCIYFCGSNCTFTDTFFGRSRGGYSAQIYPNDSTHIIDGNIFYSANEALLLAGDNHQIRNNIMISGPFTWRGMTVNGGCGIPYCMWVGQSNCVLQNNYLEGFLPINCWYGVIGINIQNNLIKVKGSNAMSIPAADSITKIDNNAWLYDAAKFDYNGFHTHWTSLGQEVNSKGLATTTFLDTSVAVENFLNTNPSHDAIFAYFRNYVASVQAVVQVATGNSYGPVPSKLGKTAPTL